MNSRMMYWAVASVTVLPLVAACGEGSAVDAQVKATYRQQLIAVCTSTASGYLPTGANLDLDKICGCAADKIMEGKSAADLATTVPGSAQDLAKVRQCATELYPDGIRIRV